MKGFRGKSAAKSGIPFCKRSGGNDQCLCDGVQKGGTREELVRGSTLETRKRVKEGARGADGESLYKAWPGTGEAVQRGGRGRAPARGNEEAWKP